MRAKKTIVFMVSLPFTLFSHNKYILTGGPCVGKTTIIELLKDNGFQVVPEAFTDLYCEAKERNQLQQFWQNSAERNRNLTLRQIEREKALDSSRPAFLDKSALETIFFAQYYKTTLTQDLVTLIENQTYATKVFMLDLLPEDCYKQTEFRTETREESVTMHSFLERWYTKRGFTIVKVPFGTVQDRVAFILQQISGDQPNSRN